MSEPLERLAGLLDRDGIETRRCADGSLLSEIIVEYGRRIELCQLRFHWRADVEAVFVTTVLLRRVLARQRAAVLELMARINPRLWLGHIELAGVFGGDSVVSGPGDAVIGELRLRVTLPGLPRQATLLRDAAEAACVVWVRYHRHLKAAAEGRLSPLETVAAGETPKLAWVKIPPARPQSDEP